MADRTGVAIAFPLAANGTNGTSDGIAMPLNPPLVAGVSALYLILLACLGIEVALSFSDFGKRRAAKYFCLAIFGLSLANLHQFFLPFQISDQAWWIIYHVSHHIGHPLFIIPVLLRSWRIICVHHKVPDIDCQPNATVKTRGDKWMIIRILVLISPFLIGLVIFLAVPQLMDQPQRYGSLEIIMTVYLLILSIANTLASLIIYRLKNKLAKHHLSEYKFLLVFALCATFLNVWETVILAITPKGSVINIYLFIPFTVVSALAALCPIVGQLCGLRSFRRQEKDQWIAQMEPREESSTLDTTSLYIMKLGETFIPESPLGGADCSFSKRSEAPIISLNDEEYLSQFSTEKESHLSNTNFYRM